MGWGVEVGDVPYGGDMLGHLWDLQVARFAHPSPKYFEVPGASTRDRLHFC